MKAFQLSAGRGLCCLIVDDRSSKTLAPHEIRVRMEAAALNYRELQTATCLVVELSPPKGPSLSRKHGRLARTRGHRPNFTCPIHGNAKC
jgi:NADPH:quinone reductase-like Zn-dependent oxidoreductase